MALPSLDPDGGRIDEQRRLRLRVLLAEHRTAVLTALLVVVALGAWVSYGAYATPGEKTVQERERAWTATGDVSHEATVTESNAIYPVGARLRNEPLYYAAISPTADVELVAGYESPTAEDVRVGLTAALVYRAVGPDGETVYWSEREPLGSTSEAGVRPGENVTAAFTVNATEVTTRITEIESDLGASPGQTEIYLAFEREIDGTIAGERRSVTDSYRIPISTEAGTYRFEAEQSYDKAYQEYETTTVPAAAGPLRTVGGPVLLVAGLGGLAGFRVAAERLPAPTAAEREWLAYRDDRDRFEEVITTVTLPATALEGPRAEPETLASLAEFGIDVGAAIVFDPTRELYVVRDDGVTYVFEPPARPWTDDGDVRGSISNPSHAPSAADGDDDRISFADGPDLSTAETAFAADDEGVSFPGASDSPSATESEPAASGAEPDSDQVDGIDDDDLLALAGLEEDDLLESAPLGRDERSGDGSGPDGSIPADSDGGDPPGNPPQL